VGTRADEINAILSQGGKGLFDLAVRVVQSPGQHVFLLIFCLVFLGVLALCVAAAVDGWNKFQQRRQETAHLRDR
jgi:hypothetical protein